MIEGGFVFEHLPLPLVHRVSSRIGRRPRTAPCSFMNCSAGMASVRSRISRARLRIGESLLFFVCQGHDAQGQDLVDLGAVKQIAALSGAICG